MKGRMQVEVMAQCVPRFGCAEGLLFLARFLRADLVLSSCAVGVL